MARKKLGEMLIEAGVLDEARLRSALADQRRWGRSLGKTLIEMKLIAEDELVRVLAKQLGMESVDLDQMYIPDAITRLVPDELCRQYQLVPFAQPMKFLDVAMADPTNLGVLDELRIRTQLNIRPFLAGPRQLERALARYYGGSTRSEAALELALDGPDMIDATPQPQPQHQRPGERAHRPSESLRPYPRTAPPPMGSTTTFATPGLGSAGHAGNPRDAEIDALQERLSRLEALVARDEEVLKKLLALLIDKGVATRDEILSRLS